MDLCAEELSAFLLPYRVKHSLLGGHVAGVPALPSSQVERR
jgi:hypothetical protein